MGCWPTHRSGANSTLYGKSGGISGTWTPSTKGCFICNLSEHAQSIGELRRAVLARKR